VKTQSRTQAKVAIRSIERCDDPIAPEIPVGQIRAGVAGDTISAVDRSDLEATPQQLAACTFAHYERMDAVGIEE
jgi:hypothetical protein